VNFGSTNANQIVDTGTAVTIISTNIYNNLPNDSRPPLENVKSALKLEVANEGLLSVLGTATLEFKIKKETYKWSVFVAPIREDGLLGLDFLQEHNFALSAEKGLRLNGKKCPTIVEKVPYRAVRVQSTETVVIPAYSEMVVKGHCPSGKISTKYGVVSSLDSEKDGSVDLMVGNTLIDSDKVSTGIPVRVMNPSPSEVKINTKTVIGQVSEVDGISVKSESSDYQCDSQVSGESEKLPHHLNGLYDSSVKNLNRNQRDKLKSLLVKHSNVFAKSQFDLGKTSVVKHGINTGDTEPIRQRPRRPPRAFKDEESKIIDEQLKANIIRESSSPWSSPLVYVKKRDGTTRPCIDYRALNATTLKDSYPLPNISDCLDSLGGSVYFSCLDILSAYYQIEMSEADRPKTAFISKYGLYEYNVMPMGLCNAPSTFQRCMELVMRGLQWEILLIYLDDLIVFSKTFDEHLERLDKVLSRLSEAGLKLKPSKCVLFKSEVSFLGHVVTEDGIKPQISKVECMQNWERPRDLTSLRSFLGFCSYYRRYIRSFSCRAQPLNRLLEAGQPFEWTAECQNSFDDLRTALTGEEVMAFPQDDGLFIVDCDASNYGIGCVLSQMQFSEHAKEFLERPIAYASKSLNKAQRRYCVTRRELLAVVTFVTMFKQYLLGRSFLIRSDHSSLRWLMSFKNPENQMARWLEVMSQFDFRIEHRKGNKHANADFLSRLQCDPCECDCYDGKTILQDLPCGGCKDCKRKHEQWCDFEEYDDVVPLITRQVSVKRHLPSVSDIVSWTVAIVLLVLSLFGDLISCLQKYARIRIPNGFHSVGRLQMSEGQPTSPEQKVANEVELNESTQEKDLGHSTHAGGLYPKSITSDQLEDTDPVDQEEVYKFSNWVGSYTRTELSKMQSEDPEIGKVLTWISQSSTRPVRDKVAAESPATRNLWLHWPQLCVKDGILFRKHEHAKGVNSFLQLIVPTLLRNQIIAASHNTITSAHLGVKKTVEKIRQNFYWYKMSDSVKLWVNTCDFCGGRKRPQKQARFPLQDYKVGFPMDRVSTDILGPFPCSDSNNKYILVIMDNFTKYVEAYAIPDQKAETVADKLVFEFFCRYGLPLDIHSDQGANYQSALFRQVCHLLEINQTRCTPYRACSNGMVERFNQSLLNMITTYVNKEQTNWDTYLPIVTSAYRSSVHESTNFTPNYLMYGRDFNLPSCFLVGCPANSQQTNVPDYVTSLQEKFTKIYEIARENIGKSSERQKRDYDTRISENCYKEGDLVYCLDSSRTVGKSPKLKAQLWKGPFVVTRKISDLLYEITGPPKSKSKVVHHDRLKRYCSTTIPQWILGVQRQMSQKQNIGQVYSDQIQQNKQSEYVKKPDYQPRRGSRTRKHPQWLGVD